MQHFTRLDFDRLIGVIQTGTGDSEKIRGTGVTSLLIESTLFAGTAVVEAAVAGHRSGAVWTTVGVVPAGTASVEGTMPGRYTHARINCTAYTSGDAEVTVVHEQD